jgi:hypothetical protein
MLTAPSFIRAKLRQETINASLVGIPGAVTVLTGIVLPLGIAGSIAVVVLGTVLILAATPFLFRMAALRERLRIAKAIQTRQREARFAQVRAQRQGLRPAAMQLPLVALAMPERRR